MRGKMGCSVQKRRPPCDFQRTLAPTEHALCPRSPAQSVAVLGGHSAEDCHLAQEYGRHIGLAFQLVDDIMDFTSTGKKLR